MRKSMFRPSHWVATLSVLYGALFFAAQPVSAADELKYLDAQVRVCDAHLEALRAEGKQSEVLKNALTIGGAIVSGIGSALAGFLGTSGQRRTAAVVGALGAILSATSSTIPDRRDLSEKVGVADVHRTIGVKVVHQLRFARPNESIVEASKYASARLDDCVAESPPRNFDQPPKVAGAAPQTTLTAPADPQPGAGPTGPAQAAPVPTTQIEFVPTAQMQRQIEQAVQQAMSVGEPHVIDGVPISKSIDDPTGEPALEKNGPAANSRP